VIIGVVPNGNNLIETNTLIIMNKYLIEKLTALRQLFIRRRFTPIGKKGWLRYIPIGKKGFGYSYRL